MTLIISALLFSIASNLDNLVIGISYGIKNIKIRYINNFIIAVITSTGTFLSMTAGLYISKFFPSHLTNAFGAIVIGMLGIYFVIENIITIKRKSNLDDSIISCKTEGEIHKKIHVNKSGNISLRETVIIACGLTLNNLGTGIAASITGVNISFTVFFTFIFSIITIIIGLSLGNDVLGNFCGKYASLFSGILLILLGIIEFFN